MRPKTIYTCANASVFVYLPFCLPCSFGIGVSKPLSDSGDCSEKEVYVI